MALAAKLFASKVPPRVRTPTERTTRHRVATLSAVDLPLLPAGCSERDIVVHVVVAGAGCHRAARRGTGRTAGAEIAAGIIGSEIAAAAPGAAFEHGQRRVEVLQHHF